LHIFYHFRQMGAFASGLGASLLAGVALWVSTHYREFGSIAAARRRRRLIGGRWYAYHLSRDTVTGDDPIWVRHDHDIRVTALGALHGSSRAEYGRRMRYRISGYVRGSVLRLYLDNLDAQESQATFVYPNLLGDEAALGVLVGEDFDRQWFLSPSVMSRGLLTPDRLAALAKTVRVNRP
jgi:hypothetical protein